MPDTSAIGQSLNALDAARLAPLVAMPDENARADTPSPSVDEEKEPFLDVRKLRTMFIDCRRAGPSLRSG